MVDVKKLRTFYDFNMPERPSAQIGVVEALSLWRRANLQSARRTLCGDRACRSALAVAPYECVACARSRTVAGSIPG